MRKRCARGRNGTIDAARKGRRGVGWIEGGATPCRTNQIPEDTLNERNVRAGVQGTIFSDGPHSALPPLAVGLPPLAVGGAGALPFVPPLLRRRTNMP